VLVASTDGRWVAMLDSPYHGDLALENPDATFAYQSVALWNLPSSTVALRLTNIEYGVGLALSPDGALVVIGGDFLEVTRTQGSGARSLYDGSIIWEKPAPFVPMSGGCMRTFAFSPDGTLLASGRNYDLDLFRTDTGASVDKLVTQLSSPGVAFSPDGLRLASSAPVLWRVAERTAVWALPTADPLANYGRGCFSDNWATFSADGTLLLTQFAQPTGSGPSWETTTTLFDSASGAVLRSLGGGLSRHPTFSPDARWILAGDRLFDVKSGQESPLGVAAALSVFLPDGRIAVADADGNVSLLCPLIER